MHYRVLEELPFAIIIVQSQLNVCWRVSVVTQEFSEKFLADDLPPYFKSQPAPEKVPCFLYIEDLVLRYSCLFVVGVELRYLHAPMLPLQSSLMLVSSLICAMCTAERWGCGSCSGRELRGDCIWWIQGCSSWGRLFETIFSAAFNCIFQ